LNRTAYNGIMSATPIGGKQQNGKFKIDSHYNFTKLKEMILECNRLLDGRTVVTCKDFQEVLSAPLEDTAIYLDPPYIVKGNGLYGYDMSNQDHCDLAAILKDLDNWVLSYDDCDFTRCLYSPEKISEIPVRYCNRNNWILKNELLITRKDSQRSRNKLRVHSVATGVMDILIN
jgi:DNA adenine methylase